jgi:hypothetical protein
VAFSPQTNYADWTTAACQRNLVPNFVDLVSRGQRGRSPTVVNLSFIDRSRYFSFKQLLIYSHKGWVYPVPDPLLLRKCGSAVNRTRDFGLQPGVLTTRPQRRSINEQRVKMSVERCGSGLFQITSWKCHEKTEDLQMNLRRIRLFA